MAGKLSEVLVRTKLASSESAIAVMDEDRRLAAEARNVLGYSVLDEHVNSSTKASTFDIGLAKLEIEPFSPESVEKYKQQAIVDHTWETPRRQNIFTCFLSVLSIGLVCVVGALIGGLIACNVWNVAEAPFWITGVAGVALCFIGFVGAGVMDDKNKAWEWERHEISQYSKPVPQFVIRKALQLKQELPDVKLYIEELISKDKVRNGDPFLVAEHGSRTVYIEVLGRAGLRKEPLNIAATANQQALIMGACFFMENFILKLKLSLRIALIPASWGCNSKNSSH